MWTKFVGLLVGGSSVQDIESTKPCGLPLEVNLSIQSILCNLVFATNDEEMHKEIVLVVDLRFLFVYCSKIATKNLWLIIKTICSCVFSSLVAMVESQRMVVN
jgi:hypothetical protein